MNRNGMGFEGGMEARRKCISPSLFQNN